jgi:hypothetical protein
MGDLYLYAYLLEADSNRNVYQEYLLGVKTAGA